MRVPLLILAAVLVTVACPPAPPEEQRRFSLLTDDLEGGALLAAWSDGEDAILVGGTAGSGPGVLVRYREGTLCVDTDVAEETLWWIHGPREGEWYAVGERGVIVHEKDGTRTREDVATDATLYGVWAGDDVVWAVGADFTTEPTRGEIWRRDSGVWSLFGEPLEGALFKVWDGWFVGEGQAFHLDGDTLVSQDVGDERFLTVRGRATDDDVWIVGGWSRASVQHYSDGVWQVVDTSALDVPLNGVWTAPGEPVWVAGMNGLTAFLDDAGWTRPEEPPSFDHFHAAWKHDDEVLFVGGNFFDTSDHHGTIVRYAIDSSAAEVVDCSSW